jgi:oligopeptide transport system substrate-binding protein
MEGTTTKALRRSGAALGLWLLLLAAGCRRQAGSGPNHEHLAAGTNVMRGNRDRILFLGNGSDPHDLDPQTVTGIPEANILFALDEGLVRLDPATLQPLPGVAASWDVSPDGTVYTFHLRPEEKWSNGEPLTAQDFVASYQRELSPGLGSQTSYFLWVLKNAHDYNKGTLKDFSQVGVHALDAHTLELTLHDPTPYLLSGLLYQRFFSPVQMSTVAKYGPIDAPGNKWARPESYVSNGPYKLVHWQAEQEVVVQRNPYYWDAANVWLKEIHFYPMDDIEVEDNAFRAGQLHATSQVAQSKIEWYRSHHPEWLHIDPYEGIYYYMLNSQRPPLNDVRVRRALAMAVDRESIVRYVTRGGQLPAHSFTPPDTAGYTARASIPTDIPGAQELLAAAGYPGGKGLPPLQILINTSDNHRVLAEAIQEMWRKSLGVEATIVNQDWGVYLDSRSTMNYQVCRAGWIGYLDPTAFLDIFLSDSPNNQVGFANPEYDRTLHEAARTLDPAARLDVLQRAEKILLDAVPVIPVYDYTLPYLIRPSVQNWPRNRLGYRSYQRITLQ